MATKLWVWQGRSPRLELWDHVRTLANQVGEPVAKLLEIPGAIVPGALRLLQALHSDRADVTLRLQAIETALGEARTAGPGGST